MIRRGMTFALLALGLGSLSGCYRVTVRSGRAESPGTPATDGASRGGFVEGIDEDEPLHMGMACGTEGGWSSVHVETSFLNGLGNVVRGAGLIYHTENITLRCSPHAAPAQAQASRSEVAVPGPAAVTAPGTTPPSM